MREFLLSRKGKITISIVALVIIIILVILLVSKCGKGDDKVSDYLPQNGDEQDIESVIIDDNDSYENEDNGGMNIVDSEDGPTNSKESTSFTDVSGDGEDSSEDSNVSDSDENQDNDDEEKNDDTNPDGTGDNEENDDATQSTTGDKFSILY